ncbi:hypothetical protein B4N84_14825 [Flavobacterium sp. IR1]|nr:hypothetical protein B4N84_14825 [Flavobacterium sp. IR1]
MTTSSQITQKNTSEILIVIDTASIKSKYLNNVAVKPIKIKEDYWFAVYQKENDEDSFHSVRIDAAKKDQIKIYGISIDEGSKDAIILNQVQNSKLFRKKVLFTPVCLSRNRISYDSDDLEELSLISMEENFIWFESDISNLGILKISFSLYCLNEDSTQQDLYGRFWFPLQITLL